MIFKYVMVPAVLGAGIVLASLAGAARAEDDAPATVWKAGAASVRITPQRRMEMAGYAGRKEPAEGTEQELYAKALAIEDAAGQRTVMITLDLIGVLDRLRTRVAERLEKEHGLPSHALLMNASHTHCGPAYGRDDATDYFDGLADTLVALAGQALERLEPATLAYCEARCGFAMNRRTPTEEGYRNHPNPAGPVDHSVPVLSVTGADGNLRAVVFGYACHNTTMGFLKWLGDYAGYAQEYFEADHPGVVALFMMGCGGDQNPYPRSELKYAQQHGRSLATAVEAALEVNQRQPLHRRTLSGPLRTTLEKVDLEFATPDRPDFAYPVQFVQFGSDLALIALGSEVTVDYALRLKRELGSATGPAIWVAGYSNVYDGYIPSSRVLLEGGYEAASRPWRPSLEERIIGKSHELFKRLNPE
ncbi:MAG: neutral/alkaline non-lysosomal ceramidase N-terminal domain-containing protein [Pirellulaceae bacterium]|nr:neutral/alkaline non-lysosomal ceramidase N-terminal domain-containing protein [Pirellulaceae bacterium]